MTMIRRTALRLGAAMALMGFAAAPALAQEFTLKLHQFLPAQANVPAHILDVWADRVEADSAGRIKIDRYPSMQLGGKPNELYDQAVDGVADIIWTVAGYTPGRFPRAEVFELPFMMQDAEVASRAFWELFESDMKDSDFKDVHMLAVWVHGPGLIHSKTPIASVADLNGVKLRAPTRTTNMLFSALGATPVGMPVPAVPESLSKGVIDAAVVPWEVTAALKVAELVGNHTEFPGAPLYTTSFVFAMNKAAYAGLPDDLKAVIDANSGAEFSAFAGRTMQEYDAPARQIAVDRGNNIISLSPEQIAEWKAAAAPVVETWKAELAAVGIDGQALIDKAVAAMARHSQ